MKTRLLILAGCLSLAACQTPSLIPPNATIPIAQGDASVDLAYNVVAQAYLAALPTMPASTKAIAKPLLVKAYAAVQAADNAERLGDATTLAAQVQSAEALIVQAKAALK
jgi:hypothetical protein